MTNHLTLVIPLLPLHPFDHRRTSKRGCPKSPPVLRSTRRLPNGVSPNQLPHPLTRARGATAARRTTDRNEAASARTALRRSSRARKKRRKNARRREREEKGQRGQIGAGSRKESARRSPVRKSEPDDGLVGIELKRMNFRVGGWGRGLVINAPSPSLHLQHCQLSG